MKEQLLISLIMLLSTGLIWGGKYARVAVGAPYIVGEVVEKIGTVNIKTGPPHEGSIWLCMQEGLEYYMYEDWLIDISDTEGAHEIAQANEIISLVLPYSRIITTGTRSFVTRMIKKDEINYLRSRGYAK